MKARILVGLAVLGLGVNAWAQDTSSADADFSTITTVLKCKHQKLTLKAPGDCDKITTLHDSPPVVKCERDGRTLFYYCGLTGDVAASEAEPGERYRGSGEISAE